MNNLKYEPMTKNEVKKAVDRKFPPRVPLIRTKWWGEGLDEQYGDKLKEFEKYPEDAVMVFIDPLEGMDFTPQYREKNDSGAKDAAGLLADWKDLDGFIKALPDPERPNLFDHLKETAEKAHQNNRYLIFGWWHLFFEGSWGLRGMENLMIDYYMNPEKVHKLHQSLCEQYVALITRAIRELDPDGFWTSDDLGNQEQLMMNPDQFREFIKPYYKEVKEACKQGDLHFWLHSCGNNTVIMEDLIEAGVDVFHPVQKHTMDEEKVAQEFGDRMTFLAGFDVQHTLQEGTPEEVREEVRYLIDTFDRKDGGMCLAAGNGIVSGTPLENIEAFLDEAYKYGKKHRQKFKEK